MAVGSKLGNMGIATTTVETAVNWAHWGDVAAALWLGLLRE